MCTGGRIKHHLVSNIGRSESTILFVGYQAMGTLGRRILEGDKKVRILGDEYLVKARVDRINGFSGHADREELLKWLGGLKRPPQTIALTHGEPEASEALGRSIKEAYGFATTLPKWKDALQLKS